MGFYMFCFFKYCCSFKCLEIKCKYSSVWYYYLCTNATACERYQLVIIIMFHVFIFQNQIKWQHLTNRQPLCNMTRLLSTTRRVHQCITIIIFCSWYWCYIKQL